MMRRSIFAKNLDQVWALRKTDGLPHEEGADIPCRDYKFSKIEAEAIQLSDKSKRKTRGR